MAHRQRENNRKGRKFEDRACKTIGSGNTWFSPLDLDYGKYCVELKFTDKKGFRVSRDLVENVWEKALTMNKEPFLIIGIKRNDNQIFTLQCRISLERNFK